MSAPFGAALFHAVNQQEMIKMKNKETSEISKEVRIYTTSTCTWCAKAKEFFKQNNVKYQEINVAENEQARNEMFEKSGQLGVPVIDIGGQVIVGFDKNALRKALKI